MPIRQKDLKLLWGRAASRCTLCRCELAHEGTPRVGSVPIGEQAHIVAEEPDGPRGNSVFTNEQRNGYPNLVLLCPTCHTKIDKAAADFPVELLHQKKAEHELWVQERLTEHPTEDAAVQLYAHLVDAVVRLGRLESWASWTSYATSPDSRWPRDFSDRIFELQQLMQTAIWPGTLSELERSLQTFTATFAAAFHVFEEHCHAEGDSLVTVRFYKISQWNPDLNHKLHEEFKVWERSCDALVREATRAVNWLAGTVRRDLNPSFFLHSGKFHLVEGPYSNLSFRSTVYEYESGIVDDLPSKLGERLAALAPAFLNVEKSPASGPPSGG